MAVGSAPVPACTAQAYEQHRTAIIQLYSFGELWELGTWRSTALARPGFASAGPPSKTPIRSARIRIEGPGGPWRCKSMIKLLARSPLLELLRVHHGRSLLTLH